MPDHSADTRNETGNPEVGGLPRPEPVLDEARVVGATTGALSLLAGIAVAAGLTSTGEADTVTAATVAAVGAVVGLINVAVAFWRARKARARVTPLASPVSASGEPLIAITALPAIATAKAAAQVPEPGEPAPTPWAEDSTLIGAVNLP